MPGKEPTDRKNFFRYLTASEEDEKWRLLCTDAGHNEIQPFTEYPPYKEAHPRSFKSVAVGRVLNEYQVVYITQGAGSFSTKEAGFSVKAGTVMFLFPGVKHGYRPDFESGWTEYWVGFNGPYADNLVEEGFLSPDKPLFDIGLRADIVALFNHVLDLVGEQQPLYQIRASATTLSIIAEVLAAGRIGAQPSQIERLVQRAKILMEESIYGEVDLGAICDTLGVSASHLNDAFKAYTAMTPYQYYISIKIQKAKGILEGGGVSIKELASRLGFRDEYYFSRLFKLKTGVSPSRWRA